MVHIISMINTENCKFDVCAVCDGSSSFERLRKVATPTKHLINGYIRESQVQLFDDIAINNPYYNIPQLINNHCMLFYHVFTWYKEKHGDGVEFVSETKVNMTETSDTLWAPALCMFKSKISSDIYILICVMSVQYTNKLNT